MDDYLKTLNEAQRKAVTTESKYVRVIAGAGSGKTRVLTTRIIHIIKEWGVAPSNILAITFTNKAAREMKDRIARMLPEEGNTIQISTIHSFCVRVLRREITKEKYPSNFTILDPDDQKSIIREAFKFLNLSAKDFNMTSILDYIANNKYESYDGQDALQHSFTTHAENMAKIYKYYLDRQAQLYALDFDDLLLWTNRILKKYPDVRKKWQEIFQFILVDEFQDIDKTQYELIRLLSDEGTYIYVVGDPDQTIYTWRGADINIIMNFEKDFKPTETIVLERNYRSTSTILNASNSLIQYNRNRVKKDLYTENETGDKIIHYSGPNEEMEAIFVCDRILQMSKGKDNYNDFAILYRSNYLSRAFEKSLMDMKIPYVIYGGVRFYDRAEIKDALSYLRLIVSEDDLSFKRVINVPKRGIGDKSLDTLLEYARSKNISMYRAVSDGIMSARVQGKLDEFVQMIEKFKIRSRDMSLEQILQMIIDDTGYRAMLETSEDPKDLERLENLKELINDIREFGEDNPNASLDDYLQMIALYTDVQSDVNGKFVSLMTIHAAKGLEFDTVFLVGFSDGIFPSEKSLMDGLKGLEEERRLAYVACTRAKKHLLITDNLGYSFTISSAKRTSRFMKEIDEEYVIPYGVSSASKPVTVRVDDYDSAPVISSSKKKYKVGDVLVHDDFGEGVLVSIEDGGKFGKIAFGFPYMTKTMSLNFAKIHKKEN